MTAEEMWKQAGLTGECDAWAFGDEADELAKLVKDGIKTGTSSAHIFYELEDEDLPEVGECSVILDSKEEPVCVIRTSKVYVVPFNEVSADHAFKEGEGDRSLVYWKEVHKEFFSEELAEVDREFNENMLVVCEEFEVIYK